MLRTVVVIIINCLKGLCAAKTFLTLKLNYGVSLIIIFLLFYGQRDVTQVGPPMGGGNGLEKGGRL